VHRRKLDRYVAAVRPGIVVVHVYSKTSPLSESLAFLEKHLVSFLELAPSRIFYRHLERRMFTCAIVRSNEAEADTPFRPLL